MNYVKILTRIILKEQEFNKKLVELIEKRNKAVLKALNKIQELK